MLKWEFSEKLRRRREARSVRVKLLLAAVSATFRQFRKFSIDKHKSNGTKPMKIILGSRSLSEPQARWIKFCVHGPVLMMTTKFFQFFFQNNLNTVLWQSEEYKHFMYTQFYVFFSSSRWFFGVVPMPGQRGFIWLVKTATRPPSRFSELLAARVAIM